MPVFDIQLGRKRWFDQMRTQGKRQRFYKVKVGKVKLEKAAGPDHARL